MSKKWAVILIIAAIAQALYFVIWGLMYGFGWKDKDK